MEAKLAESRAADGSFPSGFDEMDWPTLKRKEQALLPALVEKELVDAVGEGDLAALSAGSFRTSDGEQPSPQVDMFLALTEELAPAHLAALRQHIQGVPQQFIGPCAE